MQAARVLAAKFRSLKNLQAAGIQELNGAGIGPVLTKAVLHFFGEPRNQKMIKEMLAAGVEVQREEGLRAKKVPGAQVTEMPERDLNM